MISKEIVLFLFSILFVSSSHAQFNAPVNEFTFYRHANMVDQKLSMGVNENIPTLKLLKLDNVISSVAWDGNYNVDRTPTLLLFTNFDFREDWVIWTPGSAPNMSSYGINDRLSSAITTDYPLGFLYNRKDGNAAKGWEYPLAWGVLVYRMGGRSDEASSMFVPTGYKLCLWKDASPNSDLNSAEYISWYENPTFCASNDGQQPSTLVFPPNVVSLNNAVEGLIINLPDSINNKASAAELRDILPRCFIGKKSCWRK